mgnify:CR=1 FL=1
MAELAALSYGVGALASLALTVVLLLGWRGRPEGALLIAAALANTVWAGMLGWLLARGGTGPLAVAGADALRYGGWLAFLLYLLAGPLGRRNALLLSIPAVLFLAMEVGGTVFGPWLRQWPWTSGVGPAAPLVGGLLLAVLGLFLVEQLFRQTRPEGRWAIKYLCLGLGSLFVFDLFLFADTLLMRRTDMDLWAARGAVSLVAAPLIAVAAARNPQWALDVYVSRRMVLHSATLMGSGVYLLGMAAAGYAIRVYGGLWGGAAQALFLFAAFLLLGVLVTSGQARAALRVFLSKHFFNYKFDYREEWLRFARTLEAEDSGPLKERVIRAVAQIKEGRAGWLWQRAEEGLVPTAAWSMAPGGNQWEPGEGELARFLEETGWILEAREWRDYPERYRGIPAPDWLEEVPGAWILVPLIYQERLLGFVVVGRPRAGSESLNWEDRDLLKTVGRQAASYLAQEEAAEALSRAQQFETFNRLSAFVLHDLKNVIGQLSLLARNASRHRRNPEFIDDAVVTIEHSVERMNHLMGQLRGGQNLKPPAPVNVAEAVGKAVAAHGSGEPRPDLRLETEGAWVLADRGRLEAVISHIVQNARDATPSDGHLQVRLYRNADEVLLEVTDSGEGMSPEFIRNRLFRPFDTSKGDLGMGIGAYEAREFVRDLGGEVEVASILGAGTRFRVRLPDRILVEPPAERIKEAGN